MTRRKDKAQRSATYKLILSGSEQVRNLFGALHAYIEGFPVVVFATNGAIIHGVETLEAIAKGGITLNVATFYGINGAEFVNSDWVEMLEAARQNFMAGRPFGPSFVEFVKAGAQ